MYTLPLFPCPSQGCSFVLFLSLHVPGYTYMWHPKAELVSVFCSVCTVLFVLVKGQVIWNWFSLTGDFFYHRQVLSWGKAELSIHRNIHTLLMLSEFEDSSKEDDPVYTSYVQNIENVHKKGAAMAGSGFCHKVPICYHCFWQELIS